MLISKNHLRARHAVSKDDTRPVLCSIDVSRDGDAVVAVATDGYKLIEVREPTPSEADFPDVNAGSPVEHIRVSGPTAAKLKAAMKPNKYVPVLNYGHATDEGVVTTDLAKTVVFKDAEPDGNFPDYKKLVPEAAGARATVLLDPDLLASVLKAFEGTREVVLEIHPDKLAPVVIRTTDDDVEITGVVMPLKGRS